MRIRIIAVGKIKDKYLELGINDYLKKISRFADVEIVEIKDQPIHNEKSKEEIEIAKKKEGESILKLLKDGDYLINLDLNKKEMKSEEFAEFLDAKSQYSGSYITFAIGGSYGLSDEVKKRANDAISLSKMTFLHGMTRLIILEQIYRAYKILNNEVYHK
ncbi:MAG: 23S rRNA (pseudouridine(1915)-N(3))-methyltransferase RlmH [Erysipelotrichaceae bacterium]|nr:23S rRNA (pseudouridine(1915)-N(3))-methyltransferase RlmH [Erysipelotrichaceae bacterium]